MSIRSAHLLGILALIGCTDSPDRPARVDAGLLDAAVVDAADLDAQEPDAARLDATLADRGAPDAMDPPMDLGADLLDGGPVIDAGIDPLDATAKDQSVDAARCALEICNDLDDDCDGVIDEGEACVDAVLSGCRVHLSLRDASGAQAGIDSGSDGVFHGFGPPGDVDAGDTLSIAWRCEPALAWAQASCRIMLAHAEGSDAIAMACPAPGCVQTRGDGEPAELRLAGDVDGDDLFGVGFACAEADRDARAAAIQARVKVWIATQHRRVGADGECLDEPRHERVLQWGFCPGEPIDDEGRHRCASSAGDAAIHAFAVGTLGGIWPDLGPCDTFGVALTR